MLIRQIICVKAACWESFKAEYESLCELNFIDKDEKEVIAKITTRETQLYDRINKDERLIYLGDSELAKRVEIDIF